MAQAYPGGARFKHLKNILQGLHPYSSPLPNKCTQSTYFEQMNRFVASSALVSLVFFAASGWSYVMLSKCIHRWAGYSNFSLLLLANKEQFSYKRSTWIVGSHCFLALFTPHCSWVCYQWFMRKSTYLCRQPAACGEGFKASREFCVEINFLRKSLYYGHSSKRSSRETLTAQVSQLLEVCIYSY